MTKEEFSKEMKRLIDTFGSSQFPSQRIALLFDITKDLEIDWFARVVNQMIASMNSRIDLFEAARSERSRINAIRLADDISYAAKKFNEEISKEGFSDVLKKLNAKNLWDAVNKSKTK